MLEIPQLVVCGGNLKQLQVLRRHSWRPWETFLNEQFEPQGFREEAREPARKKEHRRYFKLPSSEGVFFGLKGGMLKVFALSTVSWTLVLFELLKKNKVCHFTHVYIG